MPFSRNLQQHNRIGPGQRSIVTLHNKIVKAMARDEFRATGKITKTQLYIKMMRARDEQWMQALKKRPSWRLSQGLAPLPPPKEKNPALESFIGG